MSIALDPEQAGASNLCTYDWDGNLLKTYAAPKLGDSAYFAICSEIAGNDEAIGVRLTVQDGGDWTDKAAMLNLASGEVSDVRPAYAR